MGDAREDAAAAQRHLWEHCDRLNVHLATDKSTAPAQTATIMGIEVRTTPRVLVRTTDTKVNKYRAGVRDLLSHPSLASLYTTLGQLHSIVIAVPHARRHLVALRRDLARHLQHGEPLELSTAGRAELAWWLDRLQERT